jgi:hypothetical protein
VIMTKISFLYINYLSERVLGYHSDSHSGEYADDHDIDMFFVNCYPDANIVL